MEDGTLWWVLPAGCLGLGLAGVFALLAVVAGVFALTGRSQQALKLFAGAVLGTAVETTIGIALWLVLDLDLTWSLLWLILGLALSLVAGLCVFAGRSRQALKLFAGALLAVAVATTITVGLGLLLHWNKGWLGLVVALSLLVAGAGQFAAAYHSPRTYAEAFGCAVASLAFVADPLLMDRFRTLRGAVAAASSLLLAIASLLTAVWSSPPGSLHQGPETSVARPRSRKRIAVILVLVNLMVFSAAFVYLPKDFFVYLPPDSYVLGNERISDALTNTRWQQVFACLFTSALLSVGLYVFLQWRNRTREARGRYYIEGRE